MENRTRGRDHRPRRGGVGSLEDGGLRRRTVARTDPARDGVTGRTHTELLLHAALSQAPDAVEARAALASLYRQAHAEAEARADAAGTLRAEALLREQAEALPPLHPDRSGHLEYLAGEGLLSLETSPEGARVHWHRYVLRGRRLVAEPERALRSTPLRRAWLPQGSHLLVLSAPGCVEVRYPVLMGRLGRWEWRGHESVEANASADPGPVVLPASGALGPQDVYVAAGPCTLGGDPEAFDAEPREAPIVGAFVMRRFPVTNAVYLVFMNDLAARGQAQEALRFAPRVAGASQFAWRGDLPVVLVDLACARAFAAWLAAREALPWRLPTAREWEKAARGVDARAFPWGDFHHPAWANLRDRSPTAPQLGGVGAQPVDESP